MIRIAIKVSLLAVAATLGVVFYSINAKDVVPLYFAIGCWAIGPPAWFWYEYYWLYCQYGEPDTLELFKYGQDVSKAIWAGVLAGLIALAASGAVKSPAANNSPNSRLEKDARETRASQP